MSKYAYKVEIEGNEGFVLDTDLLDTGLLGYLATDITSYVRSVSVKTGRSTIQDKFTAGQMSVVLDNRARVFDPNYVDSPLYGVAVPRRKMLFSIQPEPEATFVPVFDGFIDSWAYDYDVSGDSTASVSCSDAFTILANQTLTLTNPPAEKTGLRFTRALTSSSVAWPASNIVYTGDAFTMGTASYSGDVLSYLQELADSERGYLTVNYYDGVAVTLYGWNYFNAFDAAAIFSDDTSIANSIPFTNIETSYDTDQFYNYVSVTGYPGTVVSQDTTSQTDYGIAAGEFPVLQSGTAQMGVVANYIVESSKSPRFRIARIAVAFDSDLIQSDILTAVNVLGLYIGLGVQVNWTPNNVGTQTVQTGYIIGIDVSATPNSCEFAFSISGPELRDYYV